MTTGIDSRRGPLPGPFVRWADVAEPGTEIVVQAVRIAEGWVYMMEPAQGYPRAGATLRTESGHVVGPFARWPSVAGGAVKNLLADRVHVQHLTVAAGTEAAGTTAGTVVVQPLRGSIRLRLGVAEKLIDSSWVAIATAGTPWSASCPDGAELLEVRFRPQGPVAALTGLLEGVRRRLGRA